MSAVNLCPRCRIPGCALWSNELARRSRARDGLDGDGAEVIPAESGRYYARWIADARALVARCNCGWAGPLRTDAASAAADLAEHEVH